MEQAVLSRLHTAASARAEGRTTAELLGQALTLVGTELAEVRRRAAELAAEPTQPASSAAVHLLGSGGKGVRPLLALLCARAVGGQAERAIPHAVAAELVHSASLLHDDVIDDGQTRRGRPCPRVLWGNTISVLSGDLLFLQALRLIEQAGPPEILREAMQTVCDLVEGEVLQFEHKGRFETDLETYDRIVERKTASLFRWCGRAGAVAGGAEGARVDALGRFGYHVGIAFQVRDDVLDLTGDPAAMGKSFAADLVEGKLTLPIIHALAVRPDLGEVLRRVATSGASADLGDLEHISGAVVDAGGVAAARQRMHQELDRGLAALDELGDGPELQVLRSVAAALEQRAK